MLSRPLRRLSSIRSRNGQPHQSTTGVASSSSTSPCTRGVSRRSRRCPGSIAPIATASERQREPERDAEAAEHVVELGVALGCFGHQLRLERHAADAARAGLRLDDLGVHRTDPLRRRIGRGHQSGWHAGGRRGRAHRRRSRPFREPVVGIRREALAAAWIAEEVARAGMIERAATRRRGIDAHAADGVDREPQLARTRELDRRAGVVHQGALSAARSPGGRAGARR